MFDVATKAMVEVYGFPATVKTADGRRNKIKVRFTSMIKCNRVEHNVTFYLDPTFLGFDFMAKFGIIFNLENLSTNDMLYSEETGENPLNPTIHILCGQDRKQLEATIATFPSFVEKGKLI